MSENNLISIAIPTMNNSRLLAGAITSIINQSYKNWELLILDNNSNDNTEEIVNNFKNEKIQYFKSNKTLSMNQNWNRAFKYAKGKYFIKVDDDCTIFPNFLEQSLKIFNEKKSTVIFFNYYVQMLPDTFYSFMEKKDSIIELDFKKIIFLESLMLSSSNFQIFDLDQLKKNFVNKDIYYTPTPDRWLNINLVNKLIEKNEIKFIFNYNIGGINRHLIKPSYVSSSFVNYKSIKDDDIFSNKDPFTNARVNISRIFNKIFNESKQNEFQNYFEKNVTSRYHLTTFEFLGHYYELGKKKFSFSKVRSLTIYFSYILFRLLRKPFDKINYQNSIIYLIKLTKSYLINILNLKKLEKNFYKGIENSNIVSNLELINSIENINNSKSNIIIDKQIEKIKIKVNL
tara:strand:+ start:863 stop:2062 length:1200 start_codon:yes stop_codon:yes gene_type:complete